MDEDQQAGPSQWWRRDKDAKHDDQYELDPVKDTGRVWLWRKGKATSGDGGGRGYFRRFIDAAHKAAAAAPTTAGQNSSSDSIRLPSTAGSGILPDFKIRASAHQNGGGWASFQPDDEEYRSRKERDTPTGSERRRRRMVPRESISPSEAEIDTPEGPINCIVVDQDFASFVPKQWPTDDDSSNTDKADNDEGSKRSIDLDVEKGSGPTYPSDIGSPMPRRGSMAWIRKSWSSRLATAVRNFADLSFEDKETERAFQKEQWYNSRPGAALACLYIVALFVGNLALQSPWTLFHKYAYPGICGLLTLPLPFLVFFNVPMRSFWIYQWGLLCASWVWAYVFIIEMRRCDFFGPNNQCYERRYLEVFATVQGIPALALIALRQNRVLHVISTSVWLIVTLYMFHNQRGVPGIFFRNIVMAAVFNFFMAGVSYLRERADRKLFALRAQLKAQYRAVQSAQAMERRAELSKKRFVSYIFHEVRVPLNTARLALANLDGESAFDKMSDDHKDLVLGLDGSLGMMEKVLNDVLSFNRMESGNLTLARKPFSFHRAVRYVGLAHRGTAEVAGLDFDLELDPRIDAMGGVVMGDEMRFKQVCSNLISNAFKFTHHGGVRLVTKLLYPVLPEDGEAQVEVVAHPERVLPDDEPSDNSANPVEKATRRRSIVMRSDQGDNSPTHSRADSRSRSHSHTRSATSAPTTTTSTAVCPSKVSKAIIRVEVHDTGVGLSLSDVRDNRLFSPYVQTEIGRRQGGKGSGLGLALVTQIVKLCGGRLGVDSEPDKGSVFWFELPYTVPPLKENDLTPQEELVAPVLFRHRSSVSELSPSSNRKPTSATTNYQTSKSSGGSEHKERRSPSRGSYASQTNLSQAVHPVAHPRRDMSVDRSAQSPRGSPLSLGSFDQPSPDAATPDPSSTSSLIKSEQPGTLSPLRVRRSLLSSTPESSAASDPLGSVPMAITEQESPTQIDPDESDIGSGEQQVVVENNPLSPISRSASIHIPAHAPVPRLDPAPTPPRMARSQTSPPLSTAPILAPALDLPPLGPLNALVVDDDTLTRKLMARMLTRLGHNVIQAEDGRAALETIMHSWQGQSAPIDIVFLDNQMPTMFGVEVVREVRSLGCLTYIVGCTGNALREDQDEYLAAGADDVLPKPVHEGAIREQLTRAKTRTRQISVRVVE